MLVFEGVVNFPEGGVVVAVKGPQVAVVFG